MCNDSWKVDETYLKVKKVWFSLYRAIYSQGNTLEFLLSPTCDAEVMHMIRKGQRDGVTKGESRSQRVFISSLFGVVA